MSGTYPALRAGDRFAIASAPLQTRQQPTRIQVNVLPRAAKDLHHLLRGRASINRGTGLLHAAPCGCFLPAPRGTHRPGAHLSTVTSFAQGGAEEVRGA